MVSEDFTVINPTGIHARPATMLVQLCNGLPDQVMITTDKGKSVNPKNILSVLMGGMSKGTQIHIEVTGESEEDSLKLVMDLLESFTE